jgi:Tfp pilus assembly PilM family ATPase/Tfp pilus assembly protein PilN
MKMLNNIDIQRLAGIKSILGIDLTEHRARIVELQKRGRIFNRFKTTFRPLQAFTCEFSPGSSVVERVASLKRALAEHHVTSTSVVSTVQSIGVKTVTATVPSGTTNIDEWIQEHREKLLKLPVATGQVVHAYEILEHSESGLLVEITFARTSDIEAVSAFFREVGLTLLSLAAGSRDAFTAFLLGEEGPTTKDATFIHLGNSILSSATFSGGKRRTTTFTRIGPEQRQESAIDESVKQSSAPAESLVIGGDLPDTPSTGLRVLKPFGLDSSHTLAAGLALKGFFPELSPTDFLNREQREISDAQFYRSLLQRVVLASGLTIILLLLLQLGVSFYLQTRIDSVDENVLSLGPEYTEVMVLESQVKQLENQLEGRDLSFKRSQMARTLHDVARLAPQGLWLYRCQQVHQSGQPRTLSLYGYARANDLIADFVKNLTAGIAEAELVRAGTPLRSELLLPAGHGSSQFITFQINVKMRE